MRNLIVCEPHIHWGRAKLGTQAFTEDKDARQFVKLAGTCTVSYWQVHDEGVSLLGRTTLQELNPSIDWPRPASHPRR
jgi:hypothetical protein